LPQAQSILESEPLGSVLDPPTECLHKDTTLISAITALNESPVGELLILDETEHLWETLHRNDLQRIVVRIAVIRIDQILASAG
jgi:hypothetical protein